MPRKFKNEDERLIVTWYTRLTPLESEKLKQLADMLYERGVLESNAKFSVVRYALKRLLEAAERKGLV